MKVVLMTIFFEIPLNTNTIIFTENENDGSQANFDSQASHIGNRAQSPTIVRFTSLSHLTTLCNTTGCQIVTRDNVVLLSKVR